MTVIFANVEDILLSNTVRISLICFFSMLMKWSWKAFLSSLEERQKECRLYIDRIGDILKVHMSSMGVYMVCTSTERRISVNSSSTGVLRQSSNRDQSFAVTETVQSWACIVSTGVILNLLLFFSRIKFYILAPSRRSCCAEPGLIKLSFGSE